MPGHRRHIHPGPKGIVRSILVSLAAGFILLFGFTYAIQSYSGALASGTGVPPAQILTDALGAATGRELPVTGPSSTPRGEHTPRPGTNWQTQLILHGEIIIDTSGETPVFVDRDLPTTSPDDHNEPTPPRPDRATRRAAARAARRKK